MERHREPYRVVRPMLGSFQVQIPIYDRITPDMVFFYRDLVLSTFNDATYELLDKKTIFDRPIKPHSIISNVKFGSIEFEVIYQAINSIPWHEMVNCAQEGMSIGLHYLKEIGSVAGGIIALKSVGSWIKQRAKKEVKNIPSPEGDVNVNQTSQLKVDKDALSGSSKSQHLLAMLYHHKEPRCIGTIVSSTEALNELFFIPKEKNKRFKGLGGHVIIRDLNLYINGIESMSQINEGDVFFINNFSSLGLQESTDENTLYSSAYSPDADIEILSVRLESHEIPITKEPKHGHRIDADDLDDI